MNFRVVDPISTLVVAIALVALTPGGASGQDGTFTPKRTAWGDPDVSGHWLPERPHQWRRPGVNLGFLLPGRSSAVQGSGSSPDTRMHRTSHGRTGR